MDTQPMRYCHAYLLQKNRVGPTKQAFRAFIHGLWFDLYGRGGRNDSCGFEHVFCGEQRDGTVIGFHNWVKFMLEEAAGRADYRGFTLVPRTGRAPGASPTPRLLSLKFAWEDDAVVGKSGLPVKSVSTLFIGTSPEFEIALYTLCFTLGEERTRLEVAGYPVTIVCHPIQRGGRAYIGTVFPDTH
eukprot:EG_transcript_15248